jgi:urease accessory protein
VRTMISSKTRKPAWHSVCSAILLVSAIALLTPATVLAHHPEGVAGGFASGFLHPLSGIDHILAMVAVGIWGAQLGAPSIWALPIAFPLVMSIGGALGVRGVFLPGVEIGIAASALLLGFMIFRETKPPIYLAAAIVGFFALFHGYAHGTELPHAANPLAYGVGFVIATGLLHMSGVALGLIHRWPRGAQTLRLAGAGISLAGLFLLIHHIA